MLISNSNYVVCRYLYDAAPGIYAIINDEISYATMEQWEAEYQVFLSELLSLARELGHSAEGADRHIQTLSDVRPACVCGWQAPEDWREQEAKADHEVGTKVHDWLRLHLLKVVARHVKGSTITEIARRFQEPARTVTSTIRGEDL